MKANRILSLLACLTLCFTACESEFTWQEHPRNQGEDVLDVDAEELVILARGGKQTFTLNASYDGSIECEDWIKLSSKEFPGDRQTYTIVVSAEANKTGEDRQGTVIVRTPACVHAITIKQEKYERPEMPESISNAEEFVYFFKSCAPVFEADETIKFSADIDMKGITDFVPAEKFVGKIDGDGHCIRNFAATAPLVLLNQGSITNLRFDSSCSFTLPASLSLFGPFAGENYGQISDCENDAPIYVYEARSEKLYIGGVTGHNWDGKISNCVNKGGIYFYCEKSTANVYIGGMAGYSEGSIVDCHNYGPIDCKPSSMSGAYFVGGMDPRHSVGCVTGCVNHKEASIYIKSVGVKSYVGGIVGYMAGHPDCRNCANYADIYVGGNTESYVGGLQAWQEKVTDQAFTMFEGSIVNSNITAYTKASGTYGNNPCKSAGLVLGRFSGQADKQVCNFGSASAPIQVSGSVYCLATKTKVVATAKGFGPLVDGDGSATNLNSAGSTWQVFNCEYAVKGDGADDQDPENLIVKTNPVKVNVSDKGGEYSITVKANYQAKVETDVEWIELSDSTIVGDGEEHNVTITVAANPDSQVREGHVTVTLPLGTQESVLFEQAANANIPEALEVSVESIAADPAGTASTFTVKANYDAEIATEGDWFTLDATSVVGDDVAHTITLSPTKNESGAARVGKITITLPKGLSKEIALSQDVFTFTPKAEIGTVADFLDFVSFAADATLYPADYTVKLTADIDLAGKTLTPIADFLGTFNGQGHCLKNWVSEYPLFAQNKGTIENLVIDSSCKFTINPTCSTSTLYFGTICGNNGPGTEEAKIIGCTNKADITMTAASTKQAFLAGIAGRTGAASSTEDCVNKGSITVSSTEALAVEYRIAGIAGSCNGACKNCVNDAAISYSPADLSGKGCYVAGVLAYSAKLEVTGCTNTKNGKVAFTPAAYSGTSACYVAGVLGLQNNSNVISALKNFGDVTASADNDKVYVGGLVGFCKKMSSTFNALTAGSAVNCTVTAVTASADGAASANPLSRAGLVVGSFGGQAAGYVINYGTADDPVKVAGSIRKSGSDAIVLTADNYTNYVCGSASATNLFGGNAEQNVNAIYSAVTE